MPAWTVQRNCASGMQALDSAMKDISLGRSNLVLAGGTESMSHAPLLWNSEMVNWFASFRNSHHWSARLKTILKLRPQFLKPTIALLRGLSDPIVGLSMGQTAEILAYRFGITREQMDAFSLRSHQRLAEAQNRGYLNNEITPIYSANGALYDWDDGLRADS